jgi:transposase-like protein
VPRVAQQTVAATLRPIFAQPDLAAAKVAVDRLCRLFERRYTRLVDVLGQAETDVLAD